MNRKAVSGMLILLLMCTSSVFNIQPVKASGIIYIKADGSVDPPTAPIQRIGDIYTFTDNINDSIIVERNNIVLDGAGYALQGYTVQGIPYGIDPIGIVLTERNNITIKNIEVKAFDYGIWLSNSLNINISGNNITKNNDYGIYLKESLNNTISGNHITNNGNGMYLLDSGYNKFKSNIFSDNFYSFGFHGHSLSDFVQDADSNIIDGRRIYYFLNERN